MAQLDRRKFLQMVGLGSAVALLPRMPAAADVGVFKPTGQLDAYFDQEPNCIELTLNFNDNLMNDADARFALFLADEFDAEGNPILISEGEINGRSEVKIDVEANRQVTCRALGMETAQYVEASMFVQEEPTLHMVAALERNYVN